MTRALDVDCPRCGSLAGVECAECAPTSATLRPVAPHDEREASAAGFSLELEAPADELKGSPAQLVPTDEQLGFDGSRRDCAPASERLRLFEPAPAQMPGQTSLELEAGS